MLTKEQVKDLLLNADWLLVTLEDYGRSREFGTFPYFNLYAIKNNMPRRITEHSPYWSKRKFAYGMEIWGADRVFELISSVCLSVGLNSQSVYDLYAKTRLL